MKGAARLQRLRSRKVVIPLLIVLALVAGIVTARVAGSPGGYSTSSSMITGVPERDGTSVRLDTTLYVPDSTPAPAVLVSPGFGGDKSSVADTAAALAEHGYVALAYTPRGFGASGGLIHFDSPDFEVKDAELLVDHLVRLPQVDPSRIGVTGSSYGGGLALLLAAYDKRIKAVAADITWNELSHALFPNFGGDGPGVFKKLWIGTLFGEGFTSSIGASIRAAFGDDAPGASDVPTGTVSCGRFAPSVCAAYQRAATTGRAGPGMRTLMAAASPSRVLNRITAPTLLTQGEQDSLFPLSEADANARGIAANGTPVRVVWRPGGHDNPSLGDSTATSAMLDWFGTVFGGGRVSTSQPFQFSELDGRLSSSGDSLRQEHEVADGYPGVAGAARRTERFDLLGPPQEIGAPAGGTPAAITAVPGLSGILSSLGSVSAVSAATGALSVIPAQTAAFASPELSRSTTIVGSSTVRLRLTPHSSTDATLFVALRDVDSDGTNVLPSQLVSPVRLSGLTPGQATTVTVHLPTIVRTVPAGHRLVLTVATTDFGYALPQAPRTYTVALAGASGVIPSASVTVPLVAAHTVDAGSPASWLIIAAIVLALTLLVVVVVIRRRRRAVKPRPDLVDTPVSIDSLVKEYAGGYRAVDNVSFVVERGQVVGLLGPNGAGKTTALRVLVGLITPTSGTVHIFGQPVVPGASVLARVGAFIEGPGFLPHLSGRDNIRLYWAATGRPDDEAEFDTALEIAGLGASVDRKVKSYSHGMKQRLGIAQAMLGLPELLVLDEPTNGLDPPQIAEMREVMQRYAHTGRTVVVSSHLLAEVEQTCTHVVVMHKGKLVAAGTVADLAGAGGMQLAVPDVNRAAAVLAEAGIAATAVPARRALEDVFLDLIGADE
jgi:ABC-2 type transport system ATP-binding protein